MFFEAWPNARNVAIPYGNAMILESSWMLIISYVSFVHIGHVWLSKLDQIPEHIEIPYGDAMMLESSWMFISSYVSFVHDGHVWLSELAKIPEHIEIPYDNLKILESSKTLIASYVSFVYNVEFLTYWLYIGISMVFEAWPNSSNIEIQCENAMMLESSQMLIISYVSSVHNLDFPMYRFYIERRNFWSFAKFQKYWNSIWKWNAFGIIMNVDH